MDSAAIMDVFTAKRLAIVFVALLALKICALGMFGWFLVTEWQQGPDRQRVRAAASIEMQEFGNFLMFGWAALYFYLISKGQDVSWVIKVPVATVGGIVTCLGLLWKIKVFAPDGWGHVSWMFSATLTLVAALAIMML